jgi:TatD DNase family protein
VIDTHAHLDMDAFDEDREEVISRACESGVTTIITIGIDIATSRKSIELAETHSGVYATVGLHPHEAGKFGEADIAEMGRLAAHPKVVAIGETGLDLYRNYAPEEAQRQLLGWQLELAARLDKPIIIHCRQAEREVIPLLDKWISELPPGRQIPGVIHCFSGNIDAARKYLDMGFYISFGAYIGYPRSKELHAVIAGIPSDRIVVETDCPFLPPQSHRGKRNEPAYVPLTVATLATIRNVPTEAIADETTCNASRLFHLPD